MIADLPPVVAHDSGCHTHRCWARVRMHRRIRFAWRRIKAHPMPYCTWVGESSPPGDASGQWSWRRYRARNPHSTAGGKFQILYSTWLGSGGRPHGNAANAPRLEQEHIARRVLARGGLSQWVGC